MHALIEATKIVNVHCSRFDVYIGRDIKWGNPFWGNPFVIGRDGDRMAVLAKYERYVRSRPDMLDRLHELQGKVLGCHCAPLACHGDVLKKLAFSCE